MPQNVTALYIPTSPNALAPGLLTKGTPGGGGISNFSSIMLTGLMYESGADSIVAHSGGGQASATQLTAELNRVITVANPGDSVKLPASAPGLTIIVTNHGLNPMQVFGLGADTIDDIATASGVSQMQSSSVIFSCYTAGAWYTNGLASGFVRGVPLSLQTFSAVDGLVAHSGGGQASATPFTTMMNRIATCAIAGDSTLLPASSPGMNITVTNAGIASCNVFPHRGGNYQCLGRRHGLRLRSDQRVWSLFAIQPASGTRCPRCRNTG